MTNWDKLLKTLGFTESESKVYLLALELGPSPVQDIARKAGVSRMTTYTAIEVLTDRGLMSSVQKGKKMVYMAESPDRLVSFVQGKIHDIETKMREVKESVDELKLKQRGERPAVKLLEGVEGLKSLMEDILKTSPKETQEFFNAKSISEVFSHADLMPFKQKLANITAKGRAMYSGDIKIPLRSNVESKQVPPDALPFNGDIFIYKDKVALSTFHGKLITVIIESSEIAKTVQTLFDLAWKTTK